MISVLLSPQEISILIGILNSQQESSTFTRDILLALQEASK